MQGLPAAHPNTLPVALLPELIDRCEHHSKRENKERKNGAGPLPLPEIARRVEDIEYHKDEKQEFPDTDKTQTFPDRIDTLQFFNCSAVVHACPPFRAFIAISLLGITMELHYRSRHGWLLCFTHFKEKL